MFDNLKKSIASAPISALYDSGRPTLVSADSSSYGLGAVLKQRQHNSSWKPVVFASHVLNDVKRRNAQIEKECLALTRACKRFSDLLIGMQFMLQTDHKLLVTLLSPQRALDDVPPRIQHMRIRLMRFDFIIEYLPGSPPCPADTLSCFPLSVQPDLIDTSEIIERYVSIVIDALPLSDDMIHKVYSATATDDSLQRVITFCNTSRPYNLSHRAPNLQQYCHSRDRLTVQDGLVSVGS